MPKLVLPLTQLQVMNAKPRQKAYKLADGGGLYLEVTPAGGRYWRMKYRRPSGRENKLCLGVFPAVSLFDARAKRRSAKKLLITGAVPARVGAAHARQAALAASNTFEQVAREWHRTKLAQWQPRTARDILRRLESDAFPVFGQMPVGSIQPHDVLDAVRAVERRGAYEIANRLTANCSRVFRYAICCGLAERNPAGSLREVLMPREKRHFGAIGTDGLPQFLQALHEHEFRMNVSTRMAMRLMLLVFVRTSELMETPWSEIDLEKGEWIIPWQRMKRGRRRINPDRTSHHVCLSRQALCLLRELYQHTGSCTCLFPNLRDRKRPMRNNTLLKVLERIGYKGTMTGHGFRALAMSTLKEVHGYRHEVVDRQLAHAPKDRLESADDRAMYLDERRAMMQRWADYIDEVERAAGDSKREAESYAGAGSEGIQDEPGDNQEPQEVFSEGTEGARILSRTSYQQCTGNRLGSPDCTADLPANRKRGEEVEDERIIRLPEVKTITGLSRSGIYMLIRKGTFPVQVKLSTRSSGWLLSEVYGWVRSRPRVQKA